MQLTTKRYILILCCSHTFQNLGGGACQPASCGIVVVGSIDDDLQTFKAIIEVILRSGEVSQHAVNS